MVAAAEVHLAAVVVCLMTLQRHAVMDLLVEAVVVLVAVVLLLEQVVVEALEHLAVLAAYLDPPT